MIDKNDLIKIVDSYQQESDEAKKYRISLNRTNRDAYFNREDYTYKITGQSTEFLPKTSSSIEQFVSVLKNSLTQFGDWFSIEVNKNDDEQSPIDGEVLRSLLKFYISNLHVPPNKTKDFSNVVADSTKIALLESIAIVKVYGHKIQQNEFSFEGNKLGIKELRPWRLRIDLVPFEDYFPDPTGRNLYEIHESEIDLHELKKLAEAGVYDKEAVNKIESESINSHNANKRSDIHKGQATFNENKNRNTVLLREFWGTLLDEEGNILHDNVYMVDANKKYIIKKPTKNPNWHGESPFNIISIVNVPFSIFHKALYDDGVSLNRAINELFNLMLDGSIASVWGIKQLRSEYLLDQGQIQNGIPPATTLHVKTEMPQGMTVIEQVATGTVPPDALRMFNILDQEFNASVLTNDLKLGNLPPKQVKATEIVEASQAQAVTLNAILRDMETMGIAPILKKALLLILQFSDDLSSREVTKAIGERNALALSRMGQAERFAKFAMLSSINVFGVTGTLSKVKDFQKIVSIIQLSFGNPVLAQLFIKKYDIGKLLDEIWKLLNIDPAKFKNTQEQSAPSSGLNGQQPDLASLFGQLQAGMGAQMPQEAQQSGQQQQVPTEENSSEVIGRNSGV